MPLGNKRIKLRRTELGLSQQELADRSGVSPRTVQFAEAGKVMQRSTLEAIASGLNWNYDELLASGESRGSDAFLQPLGSLHRYAKHGVRPADLAFCENSDDAQGAIAMMREHWRTHLHESTPSKIDPTFERFDRLLNEHYPSYERRYLSIWERNQQTIRFATSGFHRTGVSVVLPVTESAYEKVRSGEISYLDVTDEDILPNSQHLILDSAVEFSNHPQLAWYRLTDTLNYAVFSQLAALVNDPNEPDFRMLSFGASETNIERLKANGFAANGVNMPLFDLPLFEFCADNNDLAYDRFMQVSNVCHLLRLFKRLISSTSKTRLQRAMFIKALWAYKRYSLFANRDTRRDVAAAA